MIPLIRYRRCADHQRLDRWMDIDHSVVDPTREAAERPWADRDTLPLDSNHERSPEDDEALIAVFMAMEVGIAPRLAGVVVPNLQAF